MMEEEETQYKRGVNFLKLLRKYVCLLLLLFLPPITALILGFVIFTSPNERPVLIQRYS